MKIKWKVQSKPTGYFLSTQKRGWPIAETESGQMVFMLKCPDAYSRASAMSGQHAPIKVLVRCAIPETERATKGAWHWLAVKTASQTLTDAKAMVSKFMNDFPNHDYGL